MALSSSDFDAGKIVTAETFNELKALIDEEVNSSSRREQGYIIVNDVPKESTDYASQTNSLIGALNKIKEQFDEVLQDETLLAPWLELYTKVELLKTAYPNKNYPYTDQAGCGSNCTGLCSADCTGTCETLCSGLCSGECTGACAPGCGNCGGDCTGSGCQGWFTMGPCSVMSL